MHWKNKRLGGSHSAVARNDVSSSVLMVSAIGWILRREKSLSIFEHLHILLLAIMLSAFDGGRPPRCRGCCGCGCRVGVMTPGGVLCMGRVLLAVFAGNLVVARLVPFKEIESTLIGRMSTVVSYRPTVSRETDVFGLIHGRVKAMVTAFHGFVEITVVV